MNQKIKIDVLIAMLIRACFMHCSHFIAPREYEKTFIMKTECCNKLDYYELCPSYFSVITDVGSAPRFPATTFGVPAPCGTMRQGAAPRYRDVATSTIELPRYRTTTLPKHASIILLLRLLFCIDLLRTASRLSTLRISSTVNKHQCNRLTHNNLTAPRHHADYKAIELSQHHDDFASRPGHWRPPYSRSRYRYPSKGTASSQSFLRACQSLLPYHPAIHRTSTIDFPPLYHGEPS